MARPPAGSSLLSGAISIKSSQKVEVERPSLQADMRPLSQELLESYWQRTAEDLKLNEMMGGAKVAVGEKVGVFDVLAQTTWFAEDFKAHRMEVMQHMRKLSGMPMLDCKVTPKFDEREELLYSPEKKYGVMLEHNAAMAKLRQLFPTIDY